MATNDEHLRCPYCRAKLVNSLVGVVTVFCRRCRRDITLSVTRTEAA